METKHGSGNSLLLVQPDWSPVATVRCNYQSAGRREDGKYIEYDTIPHFCILWKSDFHRKIAQVQKHMGENILPLKKDFLEGIIYYSENA